jgi:hypothetical protein
MNANTKPVFPLRCPASSITRPWPMASRRRAIDPVSQTDLGSKPSGWREATRAPGPSTAFVRVGTFGAEHGSHMSTGDARGHHPAMAFLTANIVHRSVGRA